MDKRPNVIILYADDLGYGDLSCYGACDFNTPALDKLAKSGIRFTNGHSTSAVCTPARYSLLTGEYPFRNDDAKILEGNAKCIIDSDCYTLPKLFKQADYKTAVVGKWHLGLGDGTIDWNDYITNSPNDIGFDDSFIFPATNDRVPCVYIQNHRVVNLDKNDPITVSYDSVCPFDEIETYDKNPEKVIVKSSHGHGNSIVNGVGRLGYMRGGKSAVWKDEDLAETFLSKSVNFIEENKNQPFFLYYALHQPHVPRMPNPKFVGATNQGARGDVIVEMDWCVGELIKKLEELGIRDNTMIIFSSDNGPVVDDGYMDDAEKRMGTHKPAGPLRGGKYSMFEGGARVPLLISYPDKIKPRESNALFSHVDFLASFANMLDIPLDRNVARDSQDMLDVVMGKDDIGREQLIFQAQGGGIVVCEERWAYLHPNQNNSYHSNKKMELGNDCHPQLYNLLVDVGQKENLAEAYPEIVKKMSEYVETICDKG